MNDWILEFDAETTIQFSLHNYGLLPPFCNTQYEQYGAVRSTRIDDISEDEYTCYIEFEDKQVASELKSKGFIYINDVKISINSTDHHQSVNLPTNISDQDSMPSLPDERLLEKENILNALNDDCLLSIFSKLHLRSLWSVANVCVRFNELAKENFRLKYKNIQIDFNDLALTFPISLEQVKKFFNDFGSLIVTLYVGQDDINLNEFDDILRLINQYCTNIKYLYMHDLTVNDEILTEVRPLLSRLKYLDIKCNHNRSFNDLMSSCSQLEHLCIIHVDVDESISSEVVAPKLTSLYAYQCTSNYLQPFLTVNRQLKVIYISNTSNSRDSINNTRSFIYENFPKVEFFFMFMNSVDVVGNSTTGGICLSKLKHLYKLTIRFSGQNITPLMENILENNINLKFLHIVDGSIDNHAVNCFSGMKSIEHLGFVRISGFNRQTLTSLLKWLPCLSVVDISDCNYLVDIPDIIKEAIPLAKQLKSLRISDFLRNTELPKSIEKDYREIAKVVKKPGDRPLNISVELYAIQPCGRFSICKSIYINNEWLNIELLVHV